MTESEIREVCLRIEASLTQCEELRWSEEALASKGALRGYELQVQLLCRESAPESVPTLVRITQQGTAYRQQVQLENKQASSRVTRCLDAAAFDAALALLHLAKTEPSRALLPALEALQKQAKSFHAPLEFIPIRLRLIRVLKHLNNLPIPASAPQTTEDLPIPVEEAGAS